MRVSFNWLKDYVDIRLPAEALAEKLTMAGLEVTSLANLDEDTIMEMEVTPNRTDWLSMVGIAREVAAITDKRLKAPKIYPVRGASGLGLPIQIKENKLCQCYLGYVIKNVEVKPSPEWLVQRLEALGVHPLNNIVDITNFCLLELGQPLHAFDLDRLQGPKIIVRTAREGEEFIAIDGVRRRLQSDMLVIADNTNPQAIAGIMGGKESEISQATTSILLESAYFNPLNIHNTSRSLGLATHSSYRFERGVDMAGVYLGAWRAIGLMKTLAKGKPKTASIAVSRPIGKGRSPQKTASTKVRLHYVKVAETLGVEVTPMQIRDILRRLEFSFGRKSQQGLEVNIPSFRQDITRQADLIEEIARVYGYDKIPLDIGQLTPELSSAGRLQLASEQADDAVRKILAALGWHEIMTYSLINRQALGHLELTFDNLITVKNPLSSEQEILRPTLLAGMLNAILANLNRQNTHLKLFELSRVYLSAGQAAQVPSELTNLCLGIAGKKQDHWLQKSAGFCFFDLKGIVETLLHKLGLEDFELTEGEATVFTPGRCAQLYLGQENLGAFGELKREILDRFDIAYPVYAGELSLHKLLKHICRPRRFVPLARYPAVTRDISLIAQADIRSEQIVALIKKIGAELAVKVTLFDQYFGEQIDAALPAKASAKASAGQETSPARPGDLRGLAYSIEYRSPERTLTTEEVDKLHQQIRQALTAELKVYLR